MEGYDEPSQLSPEYEQFLRERLESCINRVMVNIFEGTIEYGVVEGDWNINRRKWVEGKVVNGPNPDGEKDNRVQLLKISNVEGKIKIIMFNYACHPVTVRDTLYISGDYPARICHLLEAECFGSTAIFFQGAGGNSRPRVTQRGSEFITCTYDEMNDMSQSMTQNIMNGLLRNNVFQPFELNLDARQFKIRLELEPFAKSHIEALVADEATYPATRRIAAEVLVKYDEMPDQVYLPAGLIRLGSDHYIALLGGEPCYEVMRKLHASLGVQRLMFIGYLDSTAYIPDDKLIGEGGYEADESALEYGLKGGFRIGIDRSIAEAFKPFADQLVL